MLLSEKKLRKIIRKIILKENVDMTGVVPTFSKLPGYQKNKEINVYKYLFSDQYGPNLRDEIFRPIDYSYKKALNQPNADIQLPIHLADKRRNDYVDFLAFDIDGDPYPDVIRGMKPKSGYNKLSLSATDGSDAAKNFSKADTVSRLMDGAHFAEMSGPSAGVAMKNKVPAITDEAQAMALVNKPNVTWYGKHPYFTGRPEFADLKFEAEYSQNKAEEHGKPGMYDGWYVRMLGVPPEPHAKMVFGKVGQSVVDPEQ